MTGRFLASAAVLAIAIAPVALEGGCSSSAPAQATERLCTPGNYVYCRCANRDEGTKLCNADGMSFQACAPCASTTQATAAEDDAGARDAGFSPVDAGPAPDASASSIDARCAGRLVLLAGAGADADTDAFGAIYRGAGVFEVARSSGLPLRSNARVVAVGTSLVGVYLTSAQSIAAAKFTSAWSAPAYVGLASTDAPPAVTSTGAQAALVYRGMDGAFYAGTYADGWDDATSPAEAASDAANGGNASGPALAAAGSALVYAFTTDDGALQGVASAPSGWGARARVAGAAYAAPPAIAAMNGGTKDLLALYAGADLALRSVTRDAAGHGWSAPVTIDDSAQPTEAPALAALPNGGALAVWRESNGYGYVSVYDGASGAWSPPAELVVGHNPKLAWTPAVGEGRCGGDVVLAYAEDGGGVSVMHYASSRGWTAPTAVGGVSAVTYVGVGELP